MKELSELVVFAGEETLGHHTLNLIANCFGGGLRDLTEEARIVMRNKLACTSPRTGKESDALKACGG